MVPPGAPDKHSMEICAFAAPTGAASTALAAELTFAV